ncbi:MAG: class I SAM-dependent methyltransferase [Vulcanimicrobiaceae bacterium]
MGTAVQNGALWGAKAQEWADRQEPNHAPLWRKILDVAEVHAGTTLLDVACGAGNLGALARARGAAVTGIDASQALVDLAASRVEGTFISGEMEELPFADESFEVVTICNGLQYAADRHRAACELKRVLKKGGVAVVGMWSESEKCDMNAVFTAVKTLAPPPPGTPAPLDLSQLMVLRSLLQDAGFDVLTDGEVDVPFVYADAEDYWLAQRSAGVMESAAQRVGEEKLRIALLEAARPYTQADGRIVFHNTMRYMVAS